MKKSIKKIVSLLATATIVFSSVSALAAPDGWSTTLNISKDYWEQTVREINKSENTVKNFQTYDYGGSIQGLNKVRANFDVTYETEGGRSYMKFVPKDNSTLIEEVTQLEVTGDLYKKIGKSTGRSHFTFEFAIDDTGITKRAGGRNSMRLRMKGVDNDNDDAYSYALFAGTGWSQGTACVGVGKYDTQWAGHETNKAFVPAGTWCRYYVDYDRYTNKMVVGIKNADTEADLVGPFEVAMKKDPAFALQSALPSFNNATYYIGEMKYWKDTFVCDNASKAITDDGTTVTAKVNMANDVSTSLRASSYGVSGVNTSEPMLILAQYDANDHFLGLTTKSLSGELPRDTQTQTTAPTMREMSVTMDKADGYAYAKAFLWDSMSGLDAFSDAWTNK